MLPHTRAFPVLLPGGRRKQKEKESGKHNAPGLGGVAAMVVLGGPSIGI